MLACSFSSCVLLLILILIHYLFTVDEVADDGGLLVGRGGEPIARIRFSVAV